MKGFNLISLFIVTIATFSNGQPICDSILLDECGDELYSLLTKPQTIPTNEEELKKWCSTLEAGDKCVRNTIKDCPTVLSSVVSDGYVKSLQIANAAICSSSGKQLGKSLVKHGACLRKALNTTQCGSNFLRGAEASTLEENSQQLTSACCAYGQLDICTYTQSHKECGVEAANALRSTVNQLVVFLGELCTPRLTDPQKQCAGKASTPLPEGHRKVISALPAYVKAVGNTFGP